MFFLWLNITSGILLAVIFLMIVIFDYKNFKSEIKSIKLIVLSAFLIALAVFLNTIIKLFLSSVISTKIFEIRIGNLALVLISFFCGGALGFLSGLAADFLGLILFTTGTPVLFFTLTSVLWCVLPYYLVIFLSKIYYNKWIIYCYLFLAYGFTLLLITGINPIVLKYMYNLAEGWWLLYFPRIIKYPLDVVINGFLLIVIYRVFTNSVYLNSKIYQPKKKIKKEQVIEESLQNEVE